MKKIKFVIYNVVLQLMWNKLSTKIVNIRFTFLSILYIIKLIITLCGDFMKKVLIVLILCAIISVTAYFLYNFINTNKNVHDFDNVIILSSDQLIHEHQNTSSVIGELLRNIEIKCLSSIEAKNAITNINFYILPNKLNNYTYITDNYKNLLDTLNYKYQQVPNNSIISLNFNFNNLSNLNLFKDSNNSFTAENMISKDNTYYIIPDNSSEIIYDIKCKLTNNDSFDIVFFISTK